MEYVLIGVVIILSALILSFLVSSRREINELRHLQKNDQGFVLMQQQLDGIREQFNQQLNDIRNSVSKQIQDFSGQLSQGLTSTNKVVGDVKETLGKLGESAERIRDVGKDISNLQNILQAPKLRGLLGELFLGDLLNQIFPKKNYAMQYSFKDGEKVDAIIKLGEGMVPVDAKFPLENFRKMIDKSGDDPERKALRKTFARDVKKHIDKIAEKYIRTDEGTYEFALMYIPAENVFYETIIKDENFSEDKSIAQYALDKRVIPVSPNTFYAYLLTITYGLRGMRIEESAKEIINHLGRLKTDFNRFSVDFDTVGKHLSNAKNKYDDASKRLDRFSGKLAGIAGETEQDGIEDNPEVPLSVEGRPGSDEL